MLLLRLCEYFEYRASRDGLYSTVSASIDVVRFLLEQNGLAQRDIAAELGSESTVSLVLAGKRRLNRDHIARLSRRFHVSPSVFFGKL